MEADTVMTRAMFEQYRTYCEWTHAVTGERVMHIKDYPEIGDCFDLTPRGSVPGYCGGDYAITESGELLMADCYIKADSHIIIGSYSLFVLAPRGIWFILAVGQVSGIGSNLPRNYWIGSREPFCHNLTHVPPTLIYPSKVRRLLAPLEKCDGPARLAARYILDDMDTWDGMLIYELENRRHDGSFWGFPCVCV